MRWLLALLLVCMLPACAAFTVSCAVTPPSTGAAGQVIVLKSTVAGGIGSRYRFEVRDASDTLVYARDWTQGSSTWWTPASAGEHTITAMARDTTRTETSASMAYTVTPGLSAVSVTANVSPTIQTGVRVTFTAAATGGAAVEYRPLVGFRPSSGGPYTWDQSRPWGAGRATTFTPDTVGVYLLRVYAREHGSKRYYDVSSPDFRLTVRPSVLLVGDSIVAGYTPAVTEALANDAVVVRLPGYAINSRIALGKLRVWTNTRRWDVIVVNAGLWDLARENGLVAVPLAEHETNVGEILRIFQAQADRVRWSTTTPVNATFATRGRHSEDVPLYNAAAARATAACGVTSIDLYAHMLPRQTDFQNPADGVHFTPEGYAFLGVFVADAVRAALGERSL
jgi:lysophospholipase L1-like esterase